ncbi:MAG: phytoene/squalene synthase family protein [Deltaproteobacteria bacterium]|nr:MAG: phytoene/squalene synthase family protein [Deltaproteobacteria bacterium]
MDVAAGTKAGGTFVSDGPAAVQVSDSPQAVLAHHGRSFWLAARVLSPDQRQEAAILYAFCRHVDDLVDEADDPTRASEGLASIRAELRGETAPRPVVAAARRLVVRRGVPMHALLDLVDGVQGDLGAVAVADDRELLRYCYRVAGAVGLAMCPIIGVHDPQAAAFAVDLGVGMQITNICRDVLEDAERHRCYLPQARLLAAGTSQAALLSGAASPTAVASVVRDLLTLADCYYDSAERGMAAIPWRARVAIRIAARVYRAIGHRILDRHGGDPMHGRTVVPTGARLWLAGQAVLQSLGEAAWRRSWTLPEHDSALHLHIDDLLATVS